ncbi:MAG: hypothetical protein GKR90_21355 [Pseudomonadales bacterium]|nr:hypothetical protein [Pseudomonadales bacterium]
MHVFHAQHAVIVNEIPPAPATPENLKTERQGRDLTVTWDEVSDVDRYIVTITGSEGAHVIETTDPNAFYVLPSRGKFVIEVASQRHSLHSPGVTTEISLQRP